MNEAFGFAGAGGAVGGGINAAFGFALGFGLKPGVCGENIPGELIPGLERPGERGLAYWAYC